MGMHPVGKSIHDRLCKRVGYSHVGMGGPASTYCQMVARSVAEIEREAPPVVLLSPQPARGILVQSLRPATGCELDLARKRRGRVIGLRPWILKQPQEFYSGSTVSHPLTTISPREVHGVGDSKQAVVKRKLRRSEMLSFFAKLAWELVGIEAHHTAHYWGREIATREQRPSDAAVIR